MMKTSKIDASLQKKGFVKYNGNHSFYHLYIDGKKTKVFTKISHSSNGISDILIKTMAKQVKLTRLQFEDLIDCPLSKEEYINILIEEGEVIL